MSSRCLTSHYCQPCNIRWDRCCQYDVHLQENLSDDSQNCPKCGRYTEMTIARIVWPPEGTILVWNEKEVNDEEFRRRDYGVHAEVQALS